MRHDLSKPAVVRFQAARSHAITYVYEGRANELRHTLLPMLLAMVCITGLLIPLDHRMEHLITNMLVSKNNRIRLEAAKRTTEELGSTTDKTP